MSTGRQGAHAKSVILAGLVYLVAALVAYLPVLRTSAFLCDDFILINRARLGLGIWNYRGADFYRPTVGYTLSELWKLFGIHPFPYHVFNILLLVITALLLQAAWQTLTTQKLPWEGFQWSGFVVGLVYVLWITHAESVSWISGMTDGVAILPAVAAFYAYARYRVQPSLWRLIVTIIWLVLGLLGKEAVLTWMAIFVVFGFVVFPNKSQTRLKFAEAVGLLILTAAYIAWRSFVIGKLVGGYGSAAHLDFNLHGVIVKLTRHLANAFFPCYRVVDLRLGDQWVDLFTAISTVGTAALLIRKCPRKSQIPKWVQGFWQSMGLLGVFYVILSEVPDMILDTFEVQIYAAWGLLLIISGFGLYRIRSRIRVESSPSFLSFSLLAIVLHANIFDKVYGFALLILYFLFALSTRPTGERSEADKQLTRIGIAAFVSTFLAIVPTATLPVHLNGDSSRFSYGPSVFSAMALASVALLYIKAPKPQVAFAVPTLLASCVLLYVNNIPWEQASQISLQTTQLVGKILPARRIYILAAPGSLSAAYLFRIGIEHVGELIFGDQSVQIHVASYHLASTSQDYIDVKKSGADNFLLQLRDSPKGRRFEDSYIREAEHYMIDGWFSFPTGIVSAPSLSVKLIGFQPKTDRIIVIDETAPRVIY